MATVPKCLVEGLLLPNAVAAQYTAPAFTTATVRSITFCNTDTVDHTFTLHLVVASGAPSKATMVFNALPIKAGQTIEDDAIRNLNPGDMIQAFADTAGQVSMRVDGAEIT